MNKPAFAPSLFFIYVQPMPLMPSLFTISAAAVAMFYACGMLLLMLTLLRRPKLRQTGPLPSVSIIVAARDEERNIRACLSSLIGLRYPRELLEIIVVDDRSTDGTAGIVREFEAKYPFVLCVPADEPKPPLRGKANALAAGIGRSRGEILMFTDADCTVPPGWVEQTVVHFSDEGIGIVGGFISMGDASLFERIQSLDWLFLLSAASASTKIGFPVTAVGNNFSIRRSAYDRTGGYHAIPFSITEDFSLFQAVTEGEKLGAVIPLDAKTVVTTGPCAGWRELYAQRKRWFVGGRSMQRSRILVFLPVYLLHLFVLCGFLLTGFAVWGEIVLLKVASDILLLLPSLTRTGKMRLLRSIVPFELYLTAYVVAMPLIVLFQPRVVWKARQFDRPPARSETEQPFPAKERAVR